MRPIGHGKAHVILPSSRQQNGEEVAVQRASNLFLQQVEDSRRRYAFEVEELKVKLVHQQLWLLDDPHSNADVQVYAHHCLSLHQSVMWTVTLLHCTGPR